VLYVCCVWLVYECVCVMYVCICVCVCVCVVSRGVRLCCMCVCGTCEEEWVYTWPAAKNSWVYDLITTTLTAYTVQWNLPVVVTA